MSYGYYGQFNNLNGELSPYGTMSRFNGLLNTGCSSYSIGNYLGGFGNILSSYGMYGYGNGTYGMGNAMYNYNTMYGCGCHNGLANIGFSIANSFTTIFGTLGMSAIAHSIAAKRNEKPETLESVEKDLSAQLKILGLDYLTPSVDSDETILAKINAADQYSSTIKTLNNEIKDYEGENGKIQQRKNQVKACDAEIKRLQGERDKTGVTPEQKAEFNKQIKIQEDNKAQYIKEQQQYEKELAEKKKELEKVTKQQEAETTAKGEAKRLLTKFTNMKTEAENKAKAVTKKDAKTPAPTVETEADNMSIMDKADKTVGFRTSFDKLTAEGGKIQKTSAEGNHTYSLKDKEQLSERDVRGIIKQYRGASKAEKIALGKFIKDLNNSAAFSSFDSLTIKGVEALINDYEKLIAPAAGA